MIAEWYPDCMSLEGEYDLSLVSEPALLDLEARIIGHLKPSWCSDQKAKLIIESIVLTRPAVSVEIGAFTGSCTLPMLAGLQYLGSGLGFVIDAWSNEEAVRGLRADDVNAVWWSELDMAGIKTQFLEMLKAWDLESTCVVLAQPSRDAVAHVPAIDFLHLDGNFSEAGALLDSELYVAKVNARGYALLSNALVTAGGVPTKMKALRPFFDQCDIVCELDGGNTLLFRKR